MNFYVLFTRNSFLKGSINFLQNSYGFIIANLKIHHVRTKFRSGRKQLRYTGTMAGRYSADLRQIDHEGQNWTECVGLQVLVTVSLKGTNFWVVMACISERIRLFRGTYRLKLQGRRVTKQETSKNQVASWDVCSLLFLVWLTLRPWRQRRYVPRKLLALSELQGVRAQKTELFMDSTGSGKNQWLDLLNMERNHRVTLRAGNSSFRCTA
jgi:hypothetical protein